MRGRSLAATLALAFAGTTLAVFALVGSLLYFALDRQIKAQDDLDMVLIARHTRRLAQELQDLPDARAHADRLVVEALGNRALSMQAWSDRQERLFAHNAAMAPGADARPPSFAARVPAAGRITASAIEEWRSAQGDPMRGLMADAMLGDGSVITVLVARDMRDRWALLDHYRDRLYLAGAAGAALAFLMGFLLIRESLKPLGEMARSALAVTVARLHTRIDVPNAPCELHALQAALNAMLGRLDNGFAQLSQYTADLAHDLRTPLNNLRGTTEVALARPRGTEEYQAALVSNLEECNRLERMIGNVLFLARTEHPEFIVQRQDFDAGAELARIADYFEGVAGEAGVSVQVRGQGRLRADVELFRRAVGNLLANAVRYTPRGCAITLSAAAGGGNVTVTVANAGRPIDSVLLERIFDRFYRADPARASDQRATGSAGLGLAIVRNIMRLHRGSARAESDATGTRFILTFPAA
ncbi:heavy metal sensor histidine kinase [Cupriavidus sp. 30B13]|uniref:heavy metal sensor histidine kinase n=1 Tax=Cupriavidus sp. 30B13 TaxID=3384241 RepID=UPI003B9108C1